ncbi:serine/threonine protein kinase [Xanthomonas theicola]|uniref:Serine/threonine protein kinase n=1 Tax=Xanthomonas theicola TaxID=56464 RepID=A0A2S6ZM95_9XANT|nr:serine/threonine protein kinase [Xanthomonas theicola]PPT93393.1 serine/threonine protein kinase [Xanthomonas theicola]QNH25581.1 serine/threonine protein kinase [Xanthomonas theicola]
MHPEELKQAWQALDRRLQRHDRLQVQWLLQQNLQRVRSSLRPLLWGQILQLPFGLACIALAGLLWSRSALPAHVVAAGVAVHAYGVVTVAMAGIVVGRLLRIDYSAPVLEIQHQIARTRRWHVGSGLLCGLSWWVLWVPVLMALGALAGVDLLARAPGLVWSGLGVGVAGIAASAWLYRRSRHPGRPRLMRIVDDSLGGASLRKASRVLDEVERFRHD